MYKEMMDSIGMIQSIDPELGSAMNEELHRQRQNIELIASENIVSPGVMAAMGSVLIVIQCKSHTVFLHFFGSCICKTESCSACGGLHRQHICHIVLRSPLG